MNTTLTRLNLTLIDGTPSSACAGIPAVRMGDPAADIFAQALIDDSNHELDWLWTTSQLTDVVQRRYCLERALAINTNSELARRDLRALAARPERSEARAKAMKRFPQLHVIYSGCVECSVDVTGSMTIGRDTANDIVLAEATISRCHALLLTGAGQVTVMDLKSANGTFVNGTQVPHDAPVQLADGDLIRMGRVTARYTASSDLG